MAAMVKLCHLSDLQKVLLLCPKTDLKEKKNRKSGKVVRPCFKKNCYLRSLLNAYIVINN